MMLRKLMMAGVSDPILALFAGGKKGAWYDITDTSTLFQDSAGTTPVTATGQPIGKIVDKSPNAAHATQATATARPVIPSVGYRLRGDFVDDFIAADLGEECEVWINTPYGCYQAQGNATGYRLPLCDATGIIAVEGTLTAGERAAIVAYFGTSQVWLVVLSKTTAMYSNQVIYTGGGTTTLTFKDDTGATRTKDFSSSGGHTANYNGDLTAPMAVIFPATLIGNTSLLNVSFGRDCAGAIPDFSSNTALTTFSCYSNSLTGSIPSLSNNTALTTFSCYSNSLTGSIPSLSNNTALTTFYCYSNSLTGSIPSLSSNTALTTFYCYSNSLTGYAGGGVSATLGDWRANSNSLTQSAVDEILSDTVAAGRSSGTRVLYLHQGANSAPSAAGYADKTTLQGRGWTVNTK